MDNRFTLPATRKLMGVSAGLANYFGWDVTLVRLGWIAAFFITGGTALLAYLITGLLAPSA